MCMSLLWCKCFTISGTVCVTVSCSTIPVVIKELDTILKSTYMDDSMDSVTDEVEGIKLYKELSDLCKQAGMLTHKWLSNSSVVLKEIPQQDRAKELELDKNSSITAKTLGV